MMERVTIDGREIHSTLREEQGFELQVSEHTNEKGANVIDHARTKLATLSLEGVNSDIEPDAFSKGTDAQSMHIFLQDLYRNPRPVPVSTPRTRFDAMLVRSYRPKRDSSKYAHALHFTLELIEWRTASVVRQTVQVSQRKEVQKGRQESTKPPPPLRSFGVAAGNALVSGGLTPGAYKVPEGVVRRGG